MRKIVTVNNKCASLPSAKQLCSFGKQFWSGPGKIVSINKRKLQVQFAKTKGSFIPEWLRPIKDFQKQGEGYILKTLVTAVRLNQGSDPVSDQPEQIQVLEQFSLAPKEQLPQFSWQTEWIQARVI